jgi:hypothetical protein
MGFLRPTFKDITMENEFMTAHIGLSVFGGRFERAQAWLDREILKKMTPIIPYKTGAFLNRILNNNAGRAGTGEIRTSVPPQGRYLYPGVTARGIPFHWTNPKTQPYWGQYVVRTYQHELTKGVGEVLKGKK